MGAYVSSSIIYDDGRMKFLRKIWNSTPDRASYVSYDIYETDVLFYDESSVNNPIRVTHDIVRKPMMKSIVHDKMLDGKISKARYASLVAEFDQYLV